MGRTNIGGSQCAGPRLQLVVACIGLLVALTGTSYATVLDVPRNSVGSPELKRNAVGARQLAPGAVRSAHVLNGSLLSADFKPGQLPAGPKGDKGEKGDKGDKGDVGPPGLSGYEIVSSTQSVSGQQSSSDSVNCPSGKRVIGGGAQSFTVAFTEGPFLWRSFPMAAGTGWIASMASHSPQTWVQTTWAICANIS